MLGYEGGKVSESVKARGQLVRISFILQSYAPWASNSGHEAGCQAPLPTEHLVCPGVYIV